MFAVVTDPESSHASRTIGTRYRRGNIARGTPGFSGADLANLVNEAHCSLLVATNALFRWLSSRKQRQNHDGCGTSLHGDDGSAEESTAYHEAGHAIIGRLVPEQIRCTK